MAVILPLAFAPVAMQAGGGVAHLDLAAVDFAEGDAAQVIGVIEVGHQHLEFRAGVGARRRECV